MAPRTFLILCVASVATAFVAPRKPLSGARVARPMTMEDSTYWEGDAPPSQVLGNLASAPSALLGPVSGIFLLVGLYCVAASQIFAPLSAESVNPFYIAGSLAVPVSWGLHVAAWIQSKNGK